MSREDDPSASGPDRQPSDPPTDPAPVDPAAAAPGGDGPWVPGQGRNAGPPQGPVLPGQRTALHRRGPFPAPRGHEPPRAGAPGAGTPDAAASGPVPAAVGPTGPPNAAGSPGTPEPRGPLGAPPAGPEPTGPARPGPGDGGAGGDHQGADGRGDDGPSDAYLADRVREGDDAAYEVLYQRHVDAVRRLARLCTRTRENAEDLVGETFTRTLHALRSGHGPREACRPYLLTTVRRVAGDWARNERRVLLTDDVAAYEAGPSGEPEDPAVAATDRNLAAKAFQELPERWQAVLWYTEVEREPRDRVAPLLGVSPNALSKLKERARDGLREAYLKVYVENGLPKECRPFAKNYGAYVRNSLGDRAENNVRAHLDECDRCRAACLELASVSTCMRVAAEGLLGAAALAYLATAAAAAAAVGA
ncbi:sigma-70 family RNA polymerase sigma factor, partial [Streptodolium elevatio]